MATDETCEVMPEDIQKRHKVSTNRCACLLVLTGSQAGRLYRVDKPEIVLGRSEGCSIRLEDDGISRRHARLQQDGSGTIFIEDLKSKNGTFCNNTRVTQHALRDGDKLQLGTTTILKFSYQDGVEEQFQERQYEAATHDVLTRCYNKRYFLERLEGEINCCYRHKLHLCVAMVDIDHFKAINDTHGHLVGDIMLERIAGTMQSTLRAGDVLARFGGEEFAIIVRNAITEHALIGMDRVREAVERLRVEREGKTISATVSIGVAELDLACQMTMEALLARADSCLYHAKNSGRNRVSCRDR